MEHPRHEVPFRLVRSFLAVVRQRSFSRAAQELNLTQPAVTQHVRQLEERLGLDLLNRQSKGVTLTVAATTLMPTLRRLVHDHGVLLDEARSVRRTTRTVIRLAAPVSLSAAFLAPAFASLRRDQPDVVLILREIDDDQAFELLRAGEVDAAITGTWVPAADLVFDELFRDRACAVFARGHPLGSAKTITAEQLIQYPFIRAPLGTAADVLVERALAGKVERLKVVCEVRQLLTVLRFVAQGLGITVLPELSAKAAAPDWVEVRPLAGATLVRVCGIVLRRHLAPEPVVAELIRRLKEQVARAPLG